MRLERASVKAVKYAIMNWHYSKAVPMVQIAYAVFNVRKKWCGVICYSIGANSHISSQFGLPNGKVIELVRVALNGHQSSTSKALSISLKLICKDAPNVKLIVSYADTEQGHKGTIYQATNWYYIGDSIHHHHEHIETGEFLHNRVYSELDKTKKALYRTKKSKPKHKYIYPIDKSLIPMCKELAKPYPKK